MALNAISFLVNDWQQRKRQKKNIVRFKKSSLKTGDSLFKHKI